MTFLTGKRIIDDVLSIAPGGGASVRAKCVQWMNITAQKLAVVRPWLFLSNGSAVLLPVDNVLTLPADYGQFQSITGAGFFLDCKHRLTPGEAFLMDKSPRGFCFPRGFTEGVGTITLHGGSFTDTVSLAYAIEPQPIADSEDATAWPMQCLPLFTRTLLTIYYEFDFDERAGGSIQLDAAELSELKKWDNGQKPRSQRSRHGYRGSR